MVTILLVILLNAMLWSCSDSDSNLESYDRTQEVVGPGFTVTRYYNEEIPRHIVVLQMDVALEDNRITTALAHDGLDQGFEDVLEMSKKQDRDGHLVIGAINADYFGINDPTNRFTLLSNNMIMNYRPVITGFWERTSFGIDGSGMPFIDMVEFEGYLETGEGTSFQIAGLNVEPRPDEPVLYNEFFGETTYECENCTEWLLEETDLFKVNEPIQFKVVESSKGGGMPIQPGYIVLSAGEKIAGSLSENLEEGDSIELYYGYRSVASGDDYTQKGIKELTGGGPLLLREGRHATDDFLEYEGFSVRHSGQQHPRSAVGFNRDSTRIYFVAIDGRQSDFSIGTTLAETADIMKKLGAWNAVNLDGGGSTSLIVRNELINRHDDKGTIRPVANALLAVAEINHKDIANQIRIVSPEAPVNVSGANEPIGFEVDITDQWGYELHTAPGEITWEAVDLSGEFEASESENKKIFRALESGTGYITVTYHSLTDSLHIRVR